jgi:hypothetical protein
MGECTTVAGHHVAGTDTTTAELALTVGCAACALTAEGGAHSFRGTECIGHAFVIGRAEVSEFDGCVDRGARSRAALPVTARGDAYTRCALLIERARLATLSRASEHRVTGGRQDTHFTGRRIATERCELIVARPCRRAIVANDPRPDRRGEVRGVRRAKDAVREVVDESATLRSFTHRDAPFFPEVLERCLRWAAARQHTEQKRREVRAPHGSIVQHGWRWLGYHPSMAPLDSFEEFWPYYVSQHRNKTNRQLHFIGTSIALGCIGVSPWYPSALLIAPVAGYGFAWFGHFVFEKNKPASWGGVKAFAWSLRGDLRMWRKMLDGTMDAEVETLGPVVAQESMAV